MKISYDKATDSLYVHLADRPSVDSDEVNDGLQTTALYCYPGHPQPFWNIP
ncbi:MAG: DUF2283 domain-containing protein [Rhodoferax sp.]|nr:DUF2283 domain-containing protein [Rhodoferax sp.]